jgi:hypothetical protein
MDLKFQLQILSQKHELPRADGSDQAGQKAHANPGQHSTVSAHNKALQQLAAVE